MISIAIWSAISAAGVPGRGLYSEDGQGMDILQSAFIFALVLCTLYAGINGGRTGRAGAAIFIVATILSAVAATMNPSWATTSYGLFAVDGGCLIALIVLALHSNRYWPIWAMGFQTVAVATPCWPAPVSAMIRVLPMRIASRIWPMQLLILCAPVWFSSSRLK